MEQTIEERVRGVLEALGGGNGYGEPVALVAATKTRTAEEIDRAIRAGVYAVGENKAQEFRDKYDAVLPCPRHFIGRLQTNKIKYIAGRCDLLQSMDRDELAEALSARCERLGVTQELLVEVNVGNEESKGGYPPEAALDALARVGELPFLRPVGFMAMLPAEGGEAFLGGLADRMRALFEEARRRDPRVKWLSMGMSGDWRLCVAHGSNMIRLGSSLFGPRA